MSLITPKLTRKGLSMIVAAMNGDSITFTKAVVGNTTEEPASTLDLTDVVSPLVTAYFSSITEGENFVTLAASFLNTGIETGSYASELGLYAMDDSEEEFLYAYSYVGEKADYIPAAGSGRTVQNLMSIVVAVGDAEEVNAVLVNEAAYATKEELSDHIHDYNNPHRVTKIDVGLQKVENEYFVDNRIVVDELATAPNVATNDTLRSAFSKVHYWITKIMNQRNYLLSAYPVGAIYMSATNVNPASLFGGTWIQIQDRFLLAAGQSYAAGSTGGEARHTLSVAEMPAHAHTIKATCSQSHDVWGEGDGWLGSDNAAPGNPWIDKIYGGTGFMTQSDVPPSRGMYNTGGGQAHNNMPPYLAVYVWRRTA